MNYFNYYYCFLTVILLMITTSVSSYAQPTCNMEITKQICVNGFLEWTPTPSTTEYEVHVEHNTQNRSSTIYTTGLSTYTIVDEPKIHKDLLNQLRPLPEDTETEEPYIIRIVPLASSCSEGTMIRKQYQEGTFCSNLRIKKYETAYDDDGGGGGSKGFAAIIDSGGKSAGPGKKSINNSPPSTNQFTLTPNPVQNDLTLNAEITQNQELSIQLYNSNGQLVRQLSNNQSYNKGSHILSYDMTDLVEGVYYCAIKNGQNDQVIVKKLIKL